MPDSFKLRLRALVPNKKLVFLGAALTIIGVFLPWYSDQDRFNTGDSFLGITGPLYLAGLIVLLAASISFGLLLLKLLDKPAPKLPMEEIHFFIAGSALSLLMLILAASVYHHTKFGINLDDKNVGLGMYLGFIGSGLTMLGGILALRRKDVDFNTEGHVEPLINMEQSRPHADIALDRETTVGKAMEESRMQERVKSWGPVQETINSLREEKDQTRDIK